MTRRELVDATYDAAERLNALRREWERLNDSLPAHSTPASMLIRLEELEDDPLPRIC